MDPSNQTISIQDAAGMFRKKIGQNEKPFDVAAKKYINSLVDEYEELLRKQHGPLIVGRALFILRVLLEGKENIKFMEELKNFPECPPEKVRYWISYLKQPIEKIVQGGPSLAKIAWTVITDQIVINSRKLKHNAIFGQSTKPEVWVELASKQPTLFDTLANSYPEGMTEEIYTDMFDKYRTVSSIRVSPDN